MDRSNEPVCILRGVVPQSLCDIALRMLWLDFCNRGVSADELASWRELACPFPHLRDRPELTRLRDLHVAPALGLSDEVPCEPQLIWHLPQSEHTGQPPPHLDQEPPWAHGRRYSLIAGVALTPWRHRNGTVHWWSADGAGPLDVLLDPGDVVVMAPETRHASGINWGTEIRAGVYFRWLSQA